MNKEELIRDIRLLITHELNDLAMDSRIEDNDYTLVRKRHSEIMEYLQENLK